MLLSFFESNFWSMFLPARKNLVIGMALIRSLTKSELKSILAHEFGHFSQKSMKTGSYVYQVNRILHNLLFNNRPLEEKAEELSHKGVYFTFFIIASMQIVGGIKSILKIMYRIVNLNYLKLSREMEFHADETAVKMNGVEPFVSSMLRLDFSEHVFQHALNFYARRNRQAYITVNIYPQFTLLQSFLAQENKIDIRHGLPQPAENYYMKYNKSRLVIIDQWASHPDKEQRISRARTVGAETTILDNSPAIDIIANVESIEKRISAILLKRPKIKADQLVYIDNDQFMEEITKGISDASHHPVFNEYYDFWNPMIKHWEDEVSSEIDFKKLYNEENKEIIYLVMALERDIDILRQVAQGGTTIKSFDYDGEKYSARSAAKLVDKLEKELETLKTVLLENDKQIYFYFRSLSTQAGDFDTFLSSHQRLVDIAEEELYYNEVYGRMIESAHFFQERINNWNIEDNLVGLELCEKEFKVLIGRMLTETQALIDSEVYKMYNNYIESQPRYIINEVVIEREVDLLFNCINDFPYLVSLEYQAAKKQLLEYKLTLLPEHILLTVV